MIAETDIRLVRLLQLASPALPVGAFSYSQALETAVNRSIVRDAPTAARWIGDVMEYSVGRMEAPTLLRLIAAWRRRDFAGIDNWNGLFLASRETAELRAETAQMGFSLRKLLVELEETHEAAQAHLTRVEEIAFPTTFAFAAVHWRISTRAAMLGYLWSWLENQVMASLKAVPLGQTDGQRLLLTLGNRLSAIAERAALLEDEELGSFAPGLALLSSHHESQYSRLFRS